MRSREECPRSLRMAENSLNLCYGLSNCENFCGLTKTECFISEELQRFTHQSKYLHVHQWGIWNSLMWSFRNVTQKEEFEDETYHSGFGIHHTKRRYLKRIKYWHFFVILKMNGRYLWYFSNWKLRINKPLKS